MTDGRPDSGVKAQPGVFATTHWSVVLAAGEADTPQSCAALDKLCRAYVPGDHCRRKGEGPQKLKPTAKARADLGLCAGKARPLLAHCVSADRFTLAAMREAMKQRCGLVRRPCRFC